MEVFLKKQDLNLNALLKQKIAVTPKNLPVPLLVSANGPSLKS